MHNRNRISLPLGVLEVDTERVPIEVQTFNGPDPWSSSATLSHAGNLGVDVYLIAASAGLRGAASTWLAAAVCTRNLLARGVDCIVADFKNSNQLYVHGSRCRQMVGSQHCYYQSHVVQKRSAE